MLDRKIIQRNKQPVGQCLVKWESLAPDDATWEDAAFLNTNFPGHKLFRLEDKSILKAAALSGPQPVLTKECYFIQTVHGLVQLSDG